MGNVISTDKMEVSQLTETNKCIKDNNINKNICLKDSIIKFYYELEPNEKYHLFMGTCALIVNAATNITYPRLVGTLMDSSQGGTIPTLDKCPEYTFPFNYNIINTINEKIDCIAGNSIVGRMLFTTVPLYVIGSMASWFRVYHTQTAIYLIQKRYRRKIFEKMINQNFLFFQSKTTNYFISRILNDCEEGPKMFVESYTHSLRCFNSMIGGTFHLFSISPYLTLVSLCSIPILGVVIKKISSVVKKLQLLKKEKLDIVIGKIQQNHCFLANAEDMITSVENIISFGREDYCLESFNGTLDRCDTVSLKHNSYEGMFMGSILAGVNISTSIMVLIGSKEIGSGRITVGKFASFIIYGGLLGLGLSGISRIFNQLVKASSAMNNIYEITELEDTKDEIYTLDEVKGELELKNVWFQYPGREVNVFEDFSIKIEPGVLGIVGPSGGGKTTLARLLMKIIQPDKGDILLDSINISNLSNKWLRNSVFSVVTQEPVLFSGTIEDNIRFGNIDINLDEIIRISSAINLDKFVENLPMKYETIVGPRGTTLSTGQKQKIALENKTLLLVARAIPRRTPIFILDEPTSSLDGISEEMALLTLKMKKIFKTVIIITHKPEVLEHVDKVAIINYGLKFYGTVQEAKNNNEEFRKLFPKI